MATLSRPPKAWPCRAEPLCRRTGEGRAKLARPGVPAISRVGPSVARPRGYAFARELALAVQATPAWLTNWARAATWTPHTFAAAAIGIWTTLRATMMLTRPFWLPPPPPG